MKSYDDDKQRMHAIQIQAYESNINIYKKHISKLKEKIKKL